ncbi:isochorismatase family protein [Aurantiacibacter xanthus]|uniref:Isochorismatase family protein n=1 Tax=Aurantiacibacter xanthus TaxID=1784712 RepID=A0A3A1NZM2_9SPHN|nr:isochorismatase family protein [Aurantiacibacter xanthus]RIV80903.1 isochorismatase family protein [Aurantiacibacter xanthus]
MTFLNKVHWALAPDRCALLLHDLQPHYLAGVAGRDRVIVNAGSIARQCVSHGVPVFASQVPGARETRERGLLCEMWGRGPAPASAALDPELALADHEVRLLPKRSYSAFYGSDLDVMLRRLGRDSLIIAGVYTSIGCYLSAADAFMRDIRPFIVSDASADFDQADHAAGLATAARTCARIVTTAQVSECLGDAARRPRSHRIDVC